MIQISPTLIIELLKRIIKESSPKKKRIIKKKKKISTYTIKCLFAAKRKCLFAQYNAGFKHRVHNCTDNCHGNLNLSL